MQEFANAGETGVDYKIVVTNNGEGVALNVSVVDNLPGKLTYHNSTNSTKIWNLGDLTYVLKWQ